MSSDGMTILVAKTNGGVFLSTDGGQNFAQVSSIPSGTTTVAVSGDGMKLLAVTLASSTVYYSTNNGSTWTTKTGAVSSADNYATCMSGDGSVWMTGGSGGVYFSTNNGTTWTVDSGPGTATWFSCWINQTGSIRYFLPWGAALKISTNSGSTWTTSSTTVTDAYCLSSSSDGTKVIIGSRNGTSLYRSTNSGSTFTSLVNFGVALYDCASSGDGTKIIVATATDYPRLSTNSGVDWIGEAGPGYQSWWWEVSMSSDGTRAMAATNTANVSYVGFVPSPTTLVLSSGGSSLTTYRTANSISVTSNYPGRVTFYANGKKIGKCVSVPTVALVATCAYSPTSRGSLTITAKVVPTNAIYAALTKELFKTKVQARSGTR